MTYFAPSVEQAVAEKDRAETFGESDVSLSHDKTKVVSESIGFGTIRTSLPAFDSTASIGTSDEYGIIITPTKDVSEISAKLSNDGRNAGPFHVRLRKHSDGTLLADTDNLNAGDTVTFTGLSLTKGTDYRLTVNNDGSAFDVAYVSQDATLNGGLDVPDGYNDPSGIVQFVYAFDWVEGPGNTSGSVYIEWPYPNDVYAWDTATFQRTLDGESVSIYVEEAQGSPGWTEVAGPIARGDDIPADPANNVRFRIELSRSNTANNPTLDAIYRRWKL